MTSTRITPKTDLNPASIDLSHIDVEQALQRGRRLRAQAFTSALKSLFGRKQAEREDRKAGFGPDCAAPA